MNADVQFVLRAKYAARFQRKVYFVIMLMEKLNGPYPEFCNKNLLYIIFGDKFPKSLWAEILVQTMQLSTAPFDASCWSDF